MVECAITRNIDRPCKDLQGGISSLYLLPYAKHSRSLQRLMAVRCLGSKVLLLKYPKQR